MDIALIVVGLLFVAILIVWALAFLSDPKEVDEEEESQVRAEGPAARERARFDEAASEAERSRDEIAFYSQVDPADSSGDE